MAFGIVQLANFGVARDVMGDEPWPKLRESQRLLAKSDPHAGMVVAIDVGEADDIHLTDKATVARRLARWALADVYGKLKLSGGPEIASASVGENSVTLSFDQLGEGLRAFNSQKLLGFAVQDANGKFVKVPALFQPSRTLFLSEGWRAEDSQFFNVGVSSWGATPNHTDGTVRVVYAVGNVAQMTDEEFPKTEGPVRSDSWYFWRGRN